MISFKEYFLLSENIVNLIGPQSTDKRHTYAEEVRHTYAEEVFNLLQNAYKTIGGLKGSGFNSPEEMVQKIPFWKLYIQNGKVLIAIMYKDKAGRKTVALGTDGSLKSKQILKKLVTESYKIGWGEYSKAALKYILYTIPFDVIQPYIMSPNQVQELLPGDEIIPISQYLESGGELEMDDIKVYKRFPNLLPYFYVRVIGGTPSLKAAIGTPGKKIQ